MSSDNKMSEEEIKNILSSMTSLIDEATKNEIGDIKIYANQVLQEHKESIAKLAGLYSNGKIDKKELLRELNSEKTVVENELLAMDVIKRVTKRRENLAVIKKALEIAFDFLMRTISKSIT